MARRSSGRCTRRRAAAIRRRRVDALWSLVWKGLVTNDTLHPLRAYASAPERARRPSRATPFRSRRLIPPSAEGRWSAVGVDGARLAHRVGQGHHRTAPHPPRHRHPRRDVDRAAAGRIQRGLSGAAPAGRHRPGASRLLRGGPGRGAVRAARRGGSAPGGARCERDAAGGHAGGDRSGQPLRRAGAVAGLGGGRLAARRRGQPGRRSCWSTAIARRGSRGASARC